MISFVKSTINNPDNEGLTTIKNSIQLKEDTGGSPKELDEDSSPSRRFGSSEEEILDDFGFNISMVVDEAQIKKTHQ